MAKIYRVIQIKLNQLVQEKSITINDFQQIVFKRYHSGKLFSEFLPTRWRQKSTGIDMEQNCVTVTLCINDTSTLLFHPRDAMLWGTSYGPVSVCVCLSQIGVLSKRLNESCWFFWHGSFILPILQCVKRKFG